tara:strand:- start:42680 stop:42940 length:261 start_codon:yes stop_codon:yes gene_type:complete
MTGDKKMEFYRDEMIRDLRESDCNVIFTKVNGEERDMICTLNPDKINYELKGKETQPNDKVIRAWDINKEAFRSFRVENVKYFCKI